MGGQFVRARRPEHKRQRREAILAAARDLALTRGVRAITLGDLAEAVGLAKSNVVRYFGTREEIFVELCSEEGYRLRDTLLPRLTTVSAEDLPHVLTSTLLDHELFCELVSQLTTHLEHNVSFEAAEQLKTSSNAVLDELAAAIAARPVGLDEEQSRLLVTATAELGAALWAASRPSGVVQEVYATHPGLRPAGSMPATLERLVGALVAGLRAERPVAGHRGARHTVDP